MWKKIYVDKLDLAGQNLNQIFNFRRDHAFAPCASSITIKLPSLKWKTCPKKLLSFVPLAIGSGFVRYYDLSLNLFWFPWKFKVLLKQHLPPFSLSLSLSLSLSCSAHSELYLLVIYLWDFSLSLWAISLNSLSLSLSLSSLWAPFELSLSSLWAIWSLSELPLSSLSANSLSYLSLTLWALSELSELSLNSL